MKKTDIAMIILIAAFSMLMAYFIADAIPGLKSVNNKEQVKSMPSISQTVDTPDTKVFSPDAINPTVRVLIGSENQPVSEQKR